MGQKVRRAAKTALSRSPIDSESTGSPMKNGKSSLYEALKRRILTLELAPDQDLDEAELSEEYGISRTPMRDVLRRWREKDTLERGRFALLGSPTSSWTQSNAPMGYRMAGASVGTISRRRWRPCATSGRAATTSAIRTRRQISSARSSCRNCSTTIRSSSGPPTDRRTHRARSQRSPREACGV